MIKKSKHINMYQLVILFSLSLICFGCDSNELGSVPDDMELDLDQDGVTDFNLFYIKQTAGDPGGNFQEVKMYLSSGIHEVLKQEGEFPIFLDDIDLIQSDLDSPMYWEVTNPNSNTSFPLAWIRTDYDEITWNERWGIFSKEEKDTYLLGFKLIGVNSSQIGFIEFSIDRDTGEFILIRTEFV